MQNWKNHIFGLKDVVIFSLFFLLIGLFVGFLLAPVKKGLRIGGKNYYSKEEDDEFHEDLEMEMRELR